MELPAHGFRRASETPTPRGRAVGVFEQPLYTIDAASDSLSLSNELRPIRSTAKTLLPVPLAPAPAAPAPAAPAGAANRGSDVTCAGWAASTSSASTRPLRSK